MRTDLVADTLTVIRNAYMIKKETVDVIKNNLILSILEILKRENYISNLKVLEGQTPKLIRVYLKYDSEGKSAIIGLERVSKSSLRRYVHAKRIPKVLNGLGLAILTTSKGVVTNKEAREMKIGGEIILSVW
ncbi:MAG: 30S ribosomal protein S8 [Candidatus Omnitrophica bacterium]|nr:30S ribosomal protein S8 [Candidatus Omnitrophota bacterium]